MRLAVAQKPSAIFIRVDARVTAAYRHRLIRGGFDQADVSHVAVVRAAKNLLEDFMANTSSAKKAVRQIARRTAVNKSRRSQMRTFLRRVQEAITGGDAGAAQTALNDAAPLVMRASQKGLIHKNTASRTVSRLSKRVKALAVAQA